MNIFTWNNGPAIGLVTIPTPWQVKQGEWLNKGEDGKPEKLSLENFPLSSKVWRFGGAKVGSSLGGGTVLSNFMKFVSEKQVSMVVSHGAMKWTFIDTKSAKCFMYGIFTLHLRQEMPLL